MDLNNLDSRVSAMERRMQTPAALQVVGEAALTGKIPLTDAEKWFNAYLDSPETVGELLQSLPKSLKVFIKMPGDLINEKVLTKLAEVPGINYVEALALVETENSELVKAYASLRI